MTTVQKRAEGELNDEDDEQEQHEAGELSYTDLCFDHCSDYVYLIVFCSLFREHYFNV